jgi:hypothetical protein
MSIRAISAAILAASLVTAMTGGGACIKLCPGDNNPCDPIQYKTADNRCGSRF